MADQDATKSITAKDEVDDDKAGKTMTDDTLDLSSDKSATQNDNSPSVPVPPGPMPEPDTNNGSDSLISEKAAEAAPSTSMPTPVAPAEPVVVSENQGGQETEKLAEEIEVLTGEIQALEAKIERLTSGATTAPTESTPVAPINKDVAPINQLDSATPSTPEKKPDTPTTPMPPTPMPSPEKPADSIEKVFVNKPQSDSVQSSNVSKIDDISLKAPAQPVTPKEAEEPEKASSGGGMDIISEVVSVFGIIIFILLAISPFFKELLGQDTFLAIQQIGWLTALGTLGLGLLLTVFVRGKGLFKLMMLVLLLITAVVFLALNNNSLVSSFSSYLDPFLSFYR